MLINVGGQEQLIAFLFADVMGIDPQDGTALWSYPHKTEYGLNVSMPVWGEDNLLFLSSAYDGGSRVLRLARNGEKTTVEEVWSSKLMRVHFGNVIRIGDTVYGSSGDFGPAPITAVNVKTGQIVWRNRAFARSSLLLADGKLIILDEDGNLGLATPGAAGLEVHARCEVLKSHAWTVPTLVGTTLYLRDRRTILTLDLGAAQAASH